MEDMPTEILEKILSYVDPDFLLYKDTIEKVCSRWKNLLPLLPLWKNFEYRPGQYVSDDHICQVLKKIPSLRSLIFDKNHAGPDVLHALIEYCPNIRKLDVSKSAIDHTFLRSVHSKYPELEYLGIQNKCLSDINCADVIGEFSCLKTLIVKDDEISSFIHLKPIAEGCPALQHLDIQHLRFQAVDIQKLFQEKCSQLESLKISFANNGKGIDLSKCTALQKLSIDCTYIRIGTPQLQCLYPSSFVTSINLVDLRCTSVNIIKGLFARKNMALLEEVTVDDYYGYQDELADAIVSNCPMVRKLHLTNCCNLTDRSLVNLHKLSKLESVDLFDSRIINGVSHLIKCKQLKYLSLACCRDLRKRNLRLITRFSELEELVLHGCDVSGVNFDLIPKNMKKLRRLRISYDKMYHDVEEKLKFAMPNLIIEHPTCLLAHLYQIFKKYR